MSWTQFGTPLKTVVSITFVCFVASGTAVKLEDSEHVLTSILSYSCSFLHSRTILVNRTYVSAQFTPQFPHMFWSSSSLLSDIYFPTSVCGNLRILYAHNTTHYWYNIHAFASCLVSDCQDNIP